MIATGPPNHQVTPSATKRLQQKWRWQATAVWCVKLPNRQARMQLLL